ncbi:glycosyltransferase family 4 protein [Nocardioides sp. GY 10113]|uniref:glycosyltransferase n=1 Tax=Nocardioides sp. GY 10113 TaxID=2569761 RepID=UPI0010A811DA|nr:glycosyltransferase [Nocardioides sp. GY 10113]TIC88384.1 glycosyltransferase family 4 protein [Nocardioides sp. GY 10113]
MKILHVTETYATGVARALSGIVTAAPEHEHFLLYDGWERPAMDATFAGVMTLPAGGLRRVKAVRRALESTGAEVVHLHSSWAGVYGRVRRLDARVLYQPHCFVFEDLGRPYLHRKFYRLAERVLGRNTDVMVAVSERERALGQAVAPLATTVLVPNRSDLALVGSRPISAAPRRAVVMCGEIRSQKDPTFFAAVARRVRAEGVNAELVWVGDGDPGQRKALESSGVRVTGWLDADGLTEELDGAAIYLHTARYEGFPLSVLDAAARQVPLVVRTAAAYDGLGLDSFDTVPEAAMMVREYLAGCSTAALRNLERIRTQFDPELVAPAVARLYRGENA